MSLKQYLAVGIACLACQSAASSALAADLPEVLPTPPIEDVYRPRTEILVIGNFAENDSDFVSGSVRQNITGYIDNGFKIRVDGSRSTFDFDIGGVATRGEDLRARLLAGYSALFGITKLTVYAGGAYRDRDISPSTPFVEEGDDFGLFGSGELNFDFEWGANMQLLAEYESIADTIYTSGYYVHPFGPVRVGPTANFLDEGDYSRWAGGLRVDLPVGQHLEFTGTGAVARGGIDDDFDQDSSYVELQARATF